MKAGVTLENVYIMSEISGHVLTVPGGEEDGAVRLLRFILLKS
jgi:hypothetical protein